MNRPEPATAPVEPGAPGSRRVAKAPVVIGLLAAGLLGALTTTRVWVSGGVDDPVLGHRVVSLTGGQAAPAVLGLALAGAAAGLAVTVAARFSRVVAAVVAVLTGAGVVVTALRVFLEPAGPLRTAAAGTVGRAGHVPVSGAAATFWPLGAAVCGALLMLGGLAVLLFGRGWGGLSARYESPGRVEHPDGAPVTKVTAPRSTQRRVSDWDRLSTGDDPTVDDDPRPDPR